MSCPPLLTGSALYTIGVRLRPLFYDLHPQAYHVRRGSVRKADNEIGSTVVLDDTIMFYPLYTYTNTTFSIWCQWRTLYYIRVYRTRNTKTIRPTHAQWTRNGSHNIFVIDVFYFHIVYASLRGGGRTSTCIVLFIFIIFFFSLSRSRRLQRARTGRVSHSPKIIKIDRRSASRVFCATPGVVKRLPASLRTHDDVYAREAGERSYAIRPVQHRGVYEWIVQ